MKWKHSTWAAVLVSVTLTTAAQVVAYLPGLALGIYLRDAVPYFVFVVPYLLGSGLLSSVFSASITLAVRLAIEGCKQRVVLVGGVVHGVLMAAIVAGTFVILAEDTVTPFDVSVGVVVGLLTGWAVTRFALARALGQPSSSPDVGGAAGSGSLA